MTAADDGDPQALPNALRAALASAPPGPLAVAFSGGPDSTALVHALAGLSPARARGLRALHVDHRLHPDSQHWAQQCQALCRTLALPLTVLPVAVARASGHGLEAAAREARYQALAAALHPNERLITGHHREDQAETFLLRAVRASGPDGLAAMRPLRRLGPGWLWRPLLDLARADLRAYLRQHRLDWIDDPSNALPNNDRAWLRQNLLPILRQRWPHAEAALARSAALCAEASRLLTDQDRARLSEVRGPEAGAEAGSLRVSALIRFDPAQRARLLRLWLTELGLPPLPSQGIACIEHDLLPARPDGLAEFAWADAIVRRWRDRLHAERRQPDLPPDWSAAWTGANDLVLPTGDRLRLETRSNTLGHAPPPDPDLTAGAVFQPALRVCARRGGESLRLPGRQHHHRLKHLLQARAVPPWQRARLPLMFAADGELLAVGDTIRSARLDALLDPLGLRLRLLPMPADDHPPVYPAEDPDQERPASPPISRE